LGQKMKNMKKAEQKKRKADQKRRASEGDLPDSCGSSIGKSPASYYSDSDNIPNDSGLASSVDESIEENSKKVDKKSKKGLKKGSKDKKFEENSTVGQIHQADLIFNLDF